MTRAARAAVLAALAFALTSALAPAARALRPERAEADVQQALAEGGYAFCKHPPKPLPPHAQELCDLAREIPDCGALALACEGEPEKPSMRWEWLAALLGYIGRFGVWALLVGVVLLLGVPLAQGALRSRRDKKLADVDVAAPGEATVDEPAPAADMLTETDAERLLRQADDLAAQGKLDRALFALLSASLRALDERGAIRIERSRTGGEYVRSCREDAARGPLRELVREVDGVRFGGARPDPATVARARARAVALVRVVMVALGALLLGGCGGAKRYLNGADPAGDALFLDLLKRQGAQVSHLDTSLATMKLPGRGDRGAAVIVDAERVPLADETREHLLSWVEAGGFLVLAGEPSSWPKELGATFAKAHSRDARIFEVVRDWDREGDDAPPLVVDEKASLARASALTWKTPPDSVVGELPDKAVYAAVVRRKEGVILCVANDDLFTNVGLARPGNARALVRLLANLGRDAFKIARPEDGVVPPSNPLSALVEAGLGKALAHLPFALALLFAAAGTRLGRPRVAPPPARRAFAEHVEATGALYARTRVTAHALLCYARYADGLLRAQMPRGTSDVPAFLAARSGLPLDECARAWRRAEASLATRQTGATGAPSARGGDTSELLALKELSRIVGQATRRT